jgi:hypothetical protein
MASSRSSRVDSAVWMSRTACKPSECACKDENSQKSVPRVARDTKQSAALYRHAGTLMPAGSHHSSGPFRGRTSIEPVHMHAATCGSPCTGDTQQRSAIAVRIDMVRAWSPLRNTP